MGMVSNKIEVMLLTDSDQLFHWEMYLDNELSTNQKHNKKLFAKYSTIDEFVECIGKGFGNMFAEDDGEDNFIKWYCESYDTESYEELKNLVVEAVGESEVSNAFKKVLLVSNEQDYGQRNYSWNLYNFRVKSRLLTSGSDYVQPASDDDCEKFMETLILKK